jgi:hypothetical protein
MSISAEQIGQMVAALVALIVAIEKMVQMILALGTTP